MIAYVVLSDAQENRNIILLRITLGRLAYGTEFSSICCVSVDSNHVSMRHKLWYICRIKWNVQIAADVKSDTWRQFQIWSLDANFQILSLTLLPVCEEFQSFLPSYEAGRSCWKCLWNFEILRSVPWWWYLRMTEIQINSEVNAIERCVWLSYDIVNLISKCDYVFLLSWF